MAVRITYFVHGTTTDNEKGISSGWSDPELSDLGRKQAKDLREQTLGRKFEAVFCSDLKRAAETAWLAFEGLAPIIPDQRLRECNYGIYNGQPETIVEQLQPDFISQKFPEGESYEDVKKRMNDFLHMLKKSYDGKSIAIVSHKAPQLALEVLLKGKTWEQAFAEDWRKTKSWQPGWDYVL
ncbi:MAG: histidine phosphatase family protein [Candidatus Doudnabacteria bacterium]|nr:histidine phosphatase family protein [Candidatus Doudnabacteria bacterium]